MVEIDEIMRTTFAAREFTGEVLPDALLYEWLEHARFAPSGGNRQGNRVIVVRDELMRHQLATLSEASTPRYLAQIQLGESPWNSIYPSKVSEADMAKIAPRADRLRAFRSASVVLIFLVDLRVVASIDQDLDRVGVISGASIYPFVWNVLLQARQSGFGGTLTTGIAAQELQVQRLLNIPSYCAVACAVPMGKPVKQLRKLRRLAVEDIAVCERFDGEPFAP
ncbi:MAG: nitroreductase [Gammaproteobacteria bacterium]